MTVICMLHVAIRRAERLEQFIVHQMEHHGRCVQLLAIRRNIIFIAFVSMVLTCSLVEVVRQKANLLLAGHQTEYRGNILNRVLRRHTMQLPRWYHLVLTFMSVDIGQVTLNQYGDQRLAAHQRGHT